MRLIVIFSFHIVIVTILVSCFLQVLLVDVAPQKKRTCHRDSFDRARFLNEDGQNFFLNKYQHRSVVPERIVMYNELHDTDFCLWMQHR